MACPHPIHIRQKLDYETTVLNTTWLLYHDDDNKLRRI